MKTTFLGILSAKGGVGKTTTAINLASAINSFGRNVVLVDGNYTKPNVGLMLGITKIDTNLHHTLRGEFEITESVYAHPSGLQVIPGSILYEDLTQNNVRQLNEALTNLKGRTELVIVDCGPGFSEETMDVLKVVDCVILITTPDLVSVTDTLKTKKLCDDKGVKIIGTVVTHNTNDEYNISLSEIETALGCSVIGEIPFDNCIKNSQHKKYPVLMTDPDSSATFAYKKLAANMIGENYEPEIEESLYDYILKKIGLK